MGEVDMLYKRLTTNIDSKTRQEILHRIKTLIVVYELNN